MKKDLVIAMTGIRSRTGRLLAGRLRSEGHTVIPVPPDYGLLPGSDVLIHLGRGTRQLAARLPDAVTPPTSVLTTSARLGCASAPGVQITPLNLKHLKPEEAADLILWAVHLVENRLCLD